MVMEVLTVLLHLLPAFCLLVAAELGAQVAAMAVLVDLVAVEVTVDQQLVFAVTMAMELQVKVIEEEAELIMECPALLEEAEEVTPALAATETVQESLQGAIVQATELVGLLILGLATPSTSVRAEVEQLTEALTVLHIQDLEVVASEAMVVSKAHKVKKMDCLAATVVEVEPSQDHLGLQAAKAAVVL